MRAVVDLAHLSVGIHAITLWLSVVRDVMQLQGVKYAALYGEEYEGGVR